MIEPKTKEQRALEFVEAIAQRGFHIDTSPTMKINVTTGEMYMMWSSYVTEADNRLRACAASIINS